MERKQYADGDIPAMPDRVELGMTVAELTRRLGISDDTFHRWKRAYLQTCVAPWRDAASRQDSKAPVPAESSRPDAS